MSEFLAMGGYAIYVWSAWGLCVAVLAANWRAATRAERKAKQAVASVGGSLQ